MTALDIFPLLIVLHTAKRCPMGTWELSAETERNVKSGTIVASFPSTISLMLLRSDTRDVSVTQAGNRQWTKKCKGCGKIQDNLLHFVRSVLILSFIITKVGIANA